MVYIRHNDFKVRHRFDVDVFKLWIVGRSICDIAHYPGFKYPCQLHCVMQLNSRQLSDPYVNYVYITLDAWTSDLCKKTLVAIRMQTDTWQAAMRVLPCNAIKKPLIPVACRVIAWLFYDAWFHQHWMVHFGYALNCKRSSMLCCRGILHSSLIGVIRGRDKNPGPLGITEKRSNRRFVFDC